MRPARSVCLKLLNTSTRCHGRPHNLSVGFAIEETDRRRMVNVPSALVGEPPRRVCVKLHFFREQRKAAPSNFGALESPTARLSASRRVMRGRGALSAECLVCPLVGIFSVVMQAILPSVRRKVNQCGPNTAIQTVGKVIEFGDDKMTGTAVTWEDWRGATGARASDVAHSSVGKD